MHLTSLPGPSGIGDLGPAAYEFAQFLADSGQSWWQMLPVVPPGAGNSPYMSSSAFAGSPLMISLERLADDGLLTSADLTNTGKGTSLHRVNYPVVERFKSSRFRKAFTAFTRRKDPSSQRAMDEFCAANADWLDDYSHFCALKLVTNGAWWVDWDQGLLSRKPAALKRSRAELHDEIAYHKFLQYQFFRQWSALKTFCEERQIALLGDIPIFVAHDSAEVWGNPELFLLEKSGKPQVVAGVPPDYFCEDGQLWGNPLYAWDVHHQQKYAWWISRLKTSFRRFDALRLDHFIGFYRCWQVPATASTARVGTWGKGPAADFFEGILAGLGTLDLVAEDLGTLLPEVGELRDQFHLPGMRVLQFAFGTDPEAENYRPHSYPQRCVVYTGTHDNDTTAGWLADRGSAASTRSRDEIAKERQFALRYAASDGREPHWDMIRLAQMSVANLAVFPLQDALGLGSEARMNRPGTSTGNWEWRLAPGKLTPALSDRLRHLAETYGRNGRILKR